MKTITSRASRGDSTKAIKYLVPEFRLSLVLFFKIHTLKGYFFILYNTYFIL
jgi:hypothetical protein